MKIKSYIFILSIICIGTAINELYFIPKEKREKEERLIKHWSKSTVDFFKEFNCKSLKYTENKIPINKFFFIESYSNDYCYLKFEYYPDIDFAKYKSFENYYTKNIDDANVIIWIYEEKTKKSEGTYTNMTKAYRNRSVINYIDKNSKTIYKKEYFDYLGEPPKEIKRKSGSYGGNEEFGKKPIKNILISVSNEINSN